MELELPTDYDQHLFIEKGMRGGISMVSKRHAKANNPLVEGYDPEKPSSHIQYLEVNNLYGWAMSQPLSTGAFRWRTASCWPKPLQIIQQTIQRASSLRWIWNTQELHKAHNAFPLAPERMIVQGEWMSEYQRNLLGVGVAPTEVEKLVPNLRNKARYVLHYVSFSSTSH